MKDKDINKKIKLCLQPTLHPVKFMGSQCFVSLSESEQKSWVELDRGRAKLEQLVSHNALILHFSMFCWSDKNWRKIWQNVGSFGLTQAFRIPRWPTATATPTRMSSPSWTTPVARKKSPHILEFRKALRLRKSPRGRMKNSAGRMYLQTGGQTKTLSMCEQRRPLYPFIVLCHLLEQTWISWPSKMADSLSTCITTSYCKLSTALKKMSTSHYILFTSHLKLTTAHYKLSTSHEKLSTAHYKMSPVQN